MFTTYFVASIQPVPFPLHPPNLLHSIPTWQLVRPSRLPTTYSASIFCTSSSGRASGRANLLVADLHPRFPSRRFSSLRWHAPSPTFLLHPSFSTLEFSKLVAASRLCSQCSSSSTPSFKTLPFFNLYRHSFHPILTSLISVTLEFDPPDHSPPPDEFLF